MLLVVGHNLHMLPLLVLFQLLLLLTQFHSLLHQASQQLTTQNQLSTRQKDFSVESVFLMVLKQHTLLIPLEMPLELLLNLLKNTFQI